MRRGRPPRHYSEGAAAFAAGVAWWKNPHPACSREFYLWCEGYDDARDRAALNGHKK